MGYYDGPNGNYGDLGAAYFFFRNVGSYLPVDTDCSCSSEQATDWTILSLNPDRSKRFSLLHNRQERLWSPPHPPSCQSVNVYRCSFAEVKQSGVNIASHIYLMPRKGTNRAIPLVFLYVFMSWTLTSLFAFRTNIPYLCVALICAEYQSFEVLFCVLLRRPTSCVFLELSKKYLFFRV